MTGDTRRPRAFGDVAEEYDRIRPGATAEVLAWLLASGERRVLDLGAGTGHLTRLLEDTGVEVVAVEPDERMRAVLQRRCPRSEVLEGVAEHIPLPDASVDAVVAGSAWHWFDPEPALAEAARVLRDGGRFGVAGTSPDPYVDWVGELFDSEREPHKANVRRSYVEVEIPGGAPFGPVTTESFGSTIPLSAEDALEVFRTTSHYLVAGPGEQAGLDARRRAVLAGHTGADGLVDLPVRSWAWRTERHPR